MLKKTCFILPALAAAAVLAASLWGTEPAAGTSVPQFHTWDRCAACHNGLSTSGGEDISMSLAWRPTMMANAARDPYWHAAVRRETVDHPEARAAIEDECSICHMPMARFESRLSGHEGTVFPHLQFLPDNRGDLLAADGVSCSVCHQIGKSKLGSPESFTGGFVIDAPDPQCERLIYGPFAPDAGRSAIMRSSTGGFRPMESTHLGQSEFCATCHTLITTPLGPDGKELGRFPEQVPYQEWLNSDYRSKRSCQSCHMPVVAEDVAISSVLGVPRQGVSRHVFLGGNFFMSGILSRNRNELNVQALPDELTSAAQRTRDHLNTAAARLSLARPQMRSGRLETEVVVENMAGHKLPTAYPSRRVWLHLVMRDANGRVIFESGAVNPSGAITGNDNDADASCFEPHFAEIRDAGQVQIYEAIMADSGGRVTTGLLNAVSYLKDNRVLPLGFDKRTAGGDIAAAGGALDDADFAGGSDRIRYSIEPGAAQGPFRVEA